MSGHHLGRLQNAASISGGKKRRSRKTHKKHYRKRNTRKSRYSKKHTRSRYNKRNQRKHTSKKYKKHRGGSDMEPTRAEIERIIKVYKDQFDIKTPTKELFIETALKKKMSTGKIISILENSNGIDDEDRSPTIRSELDVNHIPESHKEVEDIIDTFNVHYDIDGCPTEEVFIETALKNKVPKVKILQKLKKSNELRGWSDDDDSDDSDDDTYDGYHKKYKPGDPEYDPDFDEPW